MTHFTQISPKPVYFIAHQKKHKAYIQEKNRVLIITTTTSRCGQQTPGSPRTTEKTRVINPLFTCFCLPAHGENSAEGFLTPKRDAVRPFARGSEKGVPQKEDDEVSSYTHYLRKDITQMDLFLFGDSWRSVFSRSLAIAEKITLSVFEGHVSRCGRMREKVEIRRGRFGRGTQRRPHE